MQTTTRRRLLALALCGATLGGIGLATAPSAPADPLLKVSVNLGVPGSGTALQVAVLPDSPCPVDGCLALDPLAQIYTQPIP
ncbi:hypothetical protein BH20ACT2_BH20ACT2_19790 [soil metagenome]